MTEQPSSVPPCKACRPHEALPFAMTMAFQPIVDARARTVFAYEALVRGAAGEPAEAILSQVNPDNRYAYDQTCRRARRCAVSLCWNCWW